MRAKEIIPQKPRNFVAKNAMKTTSGAGAHRDKKKEQKQGYEKHRGKMGESQVNEVSKDYAERERAGSQIAKILDNNKGTQWDDYTPDQLNQIQQLAKITGRRHGIWQSKKLGGEMQVGRIIDLMSKYVQQKQRDSGQMPKFTGRAPTAKAMSQQIAVQTNGETTWRPGTTWTSGRTGIRHRDPQDHIVYKDKQSYDDAWQWIESKGKKVHYKNNFDDLRTAIQIGSYIVEPSSRTRSPFGAKPETEHSVSVRSVKAIGQPTRTKQDITDQQAAAIRDIANTRGENAMKMIQALIDVLDGEEDVKRVIDQSKKIDPKDKAKLDKIIAGAGDFKEGFNQPVNEISYGDVRFKVGDWTYRADEEDEGDVRKMYHSAIDPNGKEYMIDFSPYAVMDKETFKMWIKTGMPTRKTFNSNGPVEKEDIMKLAQAKGVATLDREMARAGMK